MRKRRLPPRLMLLALTLLAACAAGGPNVVDRTGRSAPSRGEIPASGSAFGNYLVGRFASEELDTKVAADSLLLALRSEPDQPEIVRRAFVALLLDGRADALRLARRLPDNASAQLVLFGADVAGARWDRAETRARGLSRQGPVAALQPVLLAWSHAGRGQTDQAIATLRPLAEQGRFRALNALHAALIADLANRPREAERFVRQALADQPEPTLRLAMLAAGILNRAGRPAEAVRLLDQLALSSDELALAVLEPARQVVLTQRAIQGPADGIAEAYVALGSALRGQGLEEMATLMARLALRLRPSFAPALMLLADTLAEGERLDAARETLLLINENDPLFGPAQLRQAALLDRLGRVDEAEALLRRLAEALPGVPQPLTRLGDLQRRRGRFAEAVLAYDGAIARSLPARPSDWPLFYARGISRERSGNWPGAEEDLLYALTLSPEQPFVLNYLAYTWADMGVNLERARAMLEGAAAQRPQDGNIADSLGWVLFRMGLLPAAIAQLERAVELEPRNATINDHLGDVYWAAGREGEGRFQWQRALTMDPEPAEAARIQMKIDTGLPRAVRR
ncbi:tetratricopeptide repeat protein [Sediminicoccus sp. KRV36]|uniref:tetratricopeptide repeat protein n=1 Tax=Sediminicoccus sp. KRV36 TaxID=3133721 RepID=UPI00200BE326|nr:tetratricopeptide repeat protein [Sediminicoccus rosea]UPY36268.1 tetratricopeptide repeat protein [Sediminicoccus rosea]